MSAAVQRPSALCARSLSYFCILGHELLGNVDLLKCVAHHVVGPSKDVVWVVFLLGLVAGHETGASERQSQHARLACTQCRQDTHAMLKKPPL